MLYFGSFNPVHRGHIALAEYVLDAGLCDLVTLIVSPQSPYKEAAELAPELARFEMAALACSAPRRTSAPAETLLHDPYAPPSGADVRRADALLDPYGRRPARGAVGVA